MSADGIRAGRAYVELGVNNSEFVKGLNNASRKLKAFGASMMQIGGTITAPLLAATKIFSSMGDNLDKMSKRTGVSVETLSKLTYAVGLSGASMEDFEKSFKRMQYDMGKGDAEANLKAFADEIVAMDDPTEQAAAAMELFGRSGTQLLPFLKEGASGIQALLDKAKSLGLEISTNQAAAAAKFNDSMTELWLTVKKLTFAVGEALGPTIIKFAEALQTHVIKLTDWVSANKEAVVTILKIGTGLLAIGTAAMSLASAYGILTTATLGLAAAKAKLAAANTAAAVSSGAAIGKVGMGALALGGPIVAGAALLTGAAIVLDKLLTKKQSGMGLKEFQERNAKLRAEEKAEELERLKNSSVPGIGINLDKIPELSARVGVPLGQEIDVRNIGYSKLFLNSGADETGDTTTHRKLDDIAEILRNNRVAYVED